MDSTPFIKKKKNYENVSLKLILALISFRSEFQSLTQAGIILTTLTGEITF